jgi:hypothetical protein
LFSKKGSFQKKFIKKKEKKFFDMSIFQKLLLQLNRENEEHKKHIFAFFSFFVLDES